MDFATQLSGDTHNTNTRTNLVEIHDNIQLCWGEGSINSNGNDQRDEPRDSFYTVL